MTLNSYYKFLRSVGKSRYDCTASTNDYLHFETALRNQIGYNKGGLSINLVSRPSKWNKRGVEAKLAIAKRDNVTTLFLSDLKTPSIFYGDAQGTSDALIIILYENFIEIFIARGMKNIQADVCYEFTNGGLNEEINLLKSKALSFELPLK